MTPTLTYFVGTGTSGTNLGSTAPSAAGTYTVVANFAGSTDFSAASSTPLTFNITKATPNVTVSDAGGIFSGNPFPATALVNGSASLESVTPTLTYFVGTGTSGTNLGGTAPSAAGTYTVVASFAGSTDYASASSTPLTFSITKATPTVTVSDAGGTFTGNPFPATAQVNGSASLESVTPTLTYFVGTGTSGTNLGSAAPSALGTYTVVANFAGSTDYASASSSPVTFSINSASTGATVSIPLGITANAGQTAKVNVPVTATGLNTTSGLLSADFVITYNPALLSIVSSGVTLSSDLSGNDWSISKNLATPGIIRVSLFSTDQPAIQTSPEQLLNLAFTVPSGPSGTSVIGFSTTSGDVNDLNEGQLTLTTNNGSVVITGAGQTTPTVTVSDAGGTFTGNPFPATALVNGAASLEGVTPTLTYFVGTGTSGTNLGSTAPSVVGTYTVVANFAGSTDFTAASSTPLTFNITKATPTVTVSDAGGTFTGNPFPATAQVNGGATLESVTPTLTYFVGTGTSGTNLGGTAPSAAGTYTVVANFAGSTDYASASSTPVTFNITKATPNVTVSDAGGTFTGNPFPATALVNGGASLESVTPTLTYFVGTGTSGTNLGSAAPSAVGTYTVVANFAGSTDYSAASSNPVTFTIANKPAPTVTVSDAGGTFTGNPFPATALVNGSASLEGVTPTLAYFVGTGTSGTNLGSTAPSAAGTYTVVANFAGSTDYSAASSNPVTFTISKATPNVTVSDAGGIFTGNPFPGTALVGGSGSPASPSLRR